MSGGGGAFSEFAERLVENGFTVTPTNGKVPVVRRWQNPKPTDPRWLGHVLAANRYSAHNIGIVCGRVVGIDIDADDSAEIEQIKALAAEHVGPTAFQRVGRAPRTLLLYRTAAGEAIGSTKVACIDILSGGRQFVAFGIHPDTGRPYQWIGPSPATARLDELPVITAASTATFVEAVCAALRRPPEGHPAISIQMVNAALKSRQRSRQGEMLAGKYDSHIVRGWNGLVVDGREAFMAKLLAAEYAKATHASPDELGDRVWNRFIAEADLSRAKGSNPRQRWSLRDALSKARAICRRKPDLRAPRRPRGGHPASHLHAWRKPGLWTTAQRELHLAEVGRCMTAPATLAVARIMIEAVELASGFCTMPIAEIARRASCSRKSVTKARAALSTSGLWIAGPGGVFVPVALNPSQAAENKRRKSVGGNIKVPSLYHLSLVSAPKPDLPFSAAAVAP